MSRSAEALWRANAVFRFASLGYAALLLGVIDSGTYSRPEWAWVVIAVMTAWTIVTSLGYAHRRRRTAWLLGADLAVAAGLLLSTFALQYPSAQHAGMMPVTATWVAGPVIAWGIRFGRVAGAAGAVILGGCDFALRGESVTVVLNGIVLLLLAGVVVGHLAQLAADLEAERQHADRVEAAGRERERLARDIHDSVLQVLALVARRGAEAGGAAAELGRLAGQQEAALRALVGSAPSSPVELGEPGVAASRAPWSASGGQASAPGAPAAAPARSTRDRGDDATARRGEADLRALLLPCGSDKVTVSGPAGAVLLAGHAADEVLAAVRAALDNVRRHCGEHAKAWVLVEDEPSQVTVTIRDDGPGIPSGRLAEAAAAGRLGVSHSICGRLRDLGGSADVTSLPGEGAEVTLCVPRG